MTTIAYDKKRGEIAVDSRCTSDGVLCSNNVTKFVHLNGGGMGFFTGKWSEVLMLKEQVIDGGKPDPEQLEEATYIEVRNGKVTEFDGPVGERINRSSAWGSGSEYAVGAMEAGATAAQAVKIAAKYDLATGGKIHVFKVK